MPYINQEARLRLKKLVASMEENKAENPGELNYLITKLIHTYLLDHKESYQVYNDIVGALEAAKLEMYRRNITRYEQKKMSQNGDV